MARTVVALYDDLDSAYSAVQELVDAGYQPSNLSLLSNDATGEYGRFVDRLDETHVFETTDAEEGAAVGAGVGAAIGGLAGVFISLGAFAIPGIGPVVAAGPLGAALAGLLGAGAGAVAGGAAGGLLGALMDLGVPEEAAHRYAEGVRRGGHLVVVHLEGEDSASVVEILDRHGAVDIKNRAERWREQGWSGFDADVGPYSPGTETHVARTEVDPSNYNANYDDYEAYEASFRDHFASISSTELEEDVSYEDYDPAYRYGYVLANDLRYRDWAWTDVEPEARREWEARHPNTWEQVKGAVRHAWQEVKESVS